MSPPTITERISGRSLLDDSEICLLPAVHTLEERHTLEAEESLDAHTLEVQNMLGAEGYLGARTLEEEGMLEVSEATVSAADSRDRTDNARQAKASRRGGGGGAKRSSAQKRALKQEEPHEVWEEEAPLWQCRWQMGSWARKKIR